MTDNNSLVEVQDLTVTYGTAKALEIKSLHIFQNEVLAIIGPNGSGKTTLLLCLAQLLKPASGRISYHSRFPENEASILQIRRKLSAVFQEPLLLNGTVWDNVMLGLKLRNIKGKEAKITVQRWLDKFGIASLSKRQTKTLSSGEAKRTSLARAFVVQPEILLLDEPFTALDNQTRQSLLEDFKDVLKETKMTTVLVTHDLNEALALADRVVVIIKGQIHQIGSPREVFSSPSDEAVADYIEIGNVLPGEITSCTSGLACVDIEGQTIQVVSDLKSGTKVIAYIKNEDITISPSLPESYRSSARNQLKGRIEKIFPVHSQLKVTINCGFNIDSVITRQSWNDLGLTIGQEVIASFKASAVHLIGK
jgi:tungstate transport system ATP-binding protein